MPLVEIHKARRRAIKRRPEWQDTRPPEKELRAAYDIAARHVGQWSRGFMAMTRDLLTPAVTNKIKRALRDGDIDGAVKSVPRFRRNDPEGVKAWSKLSEKFKRAYTQVVTEAGENEFKREKIPLTFEVTKARRRVPVVPVNPWSLKWIDKESSKLIREVSLQTQKTIRQIIKRGFARGMRTDAILSEIKSRIGLLVREELAVQRRQDLMLSRGVPFSRATKAGAGHAAQLLTKRAQRIARTETVTAQSVGRRHAWAMAKKNGEIESDAVREWAAVVVSPRTCPICQELDGKRVAIGENYFSNVLGREVTGPGTSSHPGCRCTELLRRKSAPKSPKPDRGGAALPRPLPKWTPARDRLPKKPTPIGELSMPRTGKRIQLNARQIQASQNAKWLRGMKGLPGRVSNSERRDLLQWEWVHGAQRRTSVMMKHAAMDEFKLSGVPYARRNFKISPLEIRNTREDLRRMYNSAQSEFKNKGIKTVRLYRGIKGPTDIPGSIESWTSDPKVAKKFGTFKVMTKDVPVEKILTSHQNKGWVDGIFGPQKEYLVMN